jgi:hypothetical protein
MVTCRCSHAIPRCCRDSLPSKICCLATPLLLSSTFAVLTLSLASERWATGSLMVNWQPTHRGARRSSPLEKVHHQAHADRCDTGTDAVSSRVFRPDLSPVSGPSVGSRLDPRAADRHESAAPRAISGAGACLVLASRVVPPPMVRLDASAHVDRLPAEPGGPAGPGAPGGRRDGHRAPGPPGRWQGAAPRWGAVDPPLSRLPLGASMGGRVDARHAASRHTALGAPRLGGRVPPPGVGSRAGHTA